MSEEKPNRLFVAIPIPAFARERLAELHRELPQLSWISRENIHLTLKFIGEVEKETQAAVQKKLHEIQVKPFLLAVSGVGIFPDRGNPSVLWAGLGTAHPHLFQLHKQVNDLLFSIGIEPDRRIYRPHITLSRCKGTSRESLHPFLRKHTSFETAPFRVEMFHLLASELRPDGPRYDCLESYELNA